MSRESVTESCTCGARITYVGVSPLVAMSRFRDAHEVCRTASAEATRSATATVPTIEPTGAMPDSTGPLDDARVHVSSTGSWLPERNGYES